MLKPSAGARSVGSVLMSAAVCPGSYDPFTLGHRFVVAKAAERYLAAGKSWGEQGPKRVVREIVDSLDRDSILREAREEILAQLRRGEARG